MRRWILGRPALCFAAMCVGFAAFGLGTLNLFYLLQANLAVIASHGAMALLDGAASQLAGLVATLALSMLGYLVFKTCEHELVSRLSARAQEPPTTDNKEPSA
jgi:hypothetical protein